MQTVDWMEISKALITPAIALLGIGIAYSQYKSNELKRRYELFDRRWEMYRATIAFIDATKLVGERPLADFIESSKMFLDATSAAKYILSTEVQAYLNDLLSLSGDIAVGAERVRLEIFEDEQDKEMLEAEVTVKKISLYREELNKCSTVFAKYLQLESDDLITFPNLIYAFLWPVRFLMSAFKIENWRNSFHKSGN